MKLSYQARTKSGDIQSGIVEASSKEAAILLLQKYDLFVTFLEKAEIEPFWAKRIRFFGKTSRKDVVIFLRQLSIMFKSNIPLFEALQTCYSSQQKIDFREKILKISEEVEGGGALSKAFSLYPDVFSAFDTSMIKAGETSGQLSDSLNYLADHLEQEYAMRSKIIGAMIYPIFVLIVVLGVVIGMSIFVLPNLTEMLISSGQELPLVTKIVIFGSDFIQKWFVLIFIAIVIGVVGLMRYIKSKEGKIVFDGILIKVPLLGGVAKKIFLTRLAENLSTLIAGGIPIVQALEIVGEIVGNSVFKNVILETRDEVKKGETVSYVMRRYPELIPPLFVQMTIVGEKSGRLDSALMNIVGFFQRDTDAALAGFLAILEPAMIIGLAGIVVVVVASVILPMYQMVGSI